MTKQHLSILGIVIAWVVFPAGPSHGETPAPSCTPDCYFCVTDMACCSGRCWGDEHTPYCVGPDSPTCSGGGKDFSKVAKCLPHCHPCMFDSQCCKGRCTSDGITGGGATKLCAERKRECDEGGD